MKQKLLIALLSLTMILVLVGCGENSSVVSKDDAGASAGQVSTGAEVPPADGSSPASPSSVDTPVAGAEGTITAEKAKEIALSHLGIDASAIYDFEVEFDRDDGVPSYEIEFKSAGAEYDYDIHAETGKILKAEKNDKSLIPADTSKFKSEAEVKQIALSHAGISEANAKALVIEPDLDDGIPSYEIDFKSGGYEYEYDIHAETGKILKSEKELDD